MKYNKYGKKFQKKILAINVKRRFFFLTERFIK